MMNWNISLSLSMEKKTQNNTGVSKFHATTKSDVEAFMQGKKRKKTRSEEQQQDLLKKNPDRDAQKTAYEGAFEIIDPIETCVGPIGKWIPKLENLPHAPSIAAFGKRRTGKSFTFRWIMYNCFRHIPFGVVFSHTSFNGYWQKYVPPKFVFQGLPEHTLKALTDRQRKLITKFRKEHPGKDPKEEPSIQAFVILDDVVADKVAMMWNTQINSLFVEGRHLCITVLITTQHVTGVGPMIRGNCDLVILQPIFAKDARDTLAKLYGGHMEKDHFYEMLNEVVLDENMPGSTPQEPKKHVRTLVINDFENTIDPQIKFKWLESEDPGDFRLCKPEYWKEDIDTQIQMSNQSDVPDVIDELDEVRSLF
jgi:hypothetical protein